MEGSGYALEDFTVGELVLVKNVNRKEPWWPVCVQACPAANSAWRTLYTGTVRSPFEVDILPGDRFGPHQRGTGNSQEADAAGETVYHVLWSTGKQGWTLASVLTLCCSLCQLKHADTYIT